MNFTTCILPWAKEKIRGHSFVNSRKVQKFLGIKVELTEDSFVYNEERGIFQLTEELRHGDLLGKGKEFQNVLFFFQNVLK